MHITSNCFSRLVSDRLSFLAVAVHIGVSLTATSQFEYKYAMALSQNTSDRITQTISPTLWASLKENFRQVTDSDEIDDNTTWQQPTTVSVCKLVESALAFSGNTQSGDYDTIRTEIELYVTRISMSEKKLLRGKT